MSDKTLPPDGLNPAGAGERVAWPLPGWHDLAPKARMAAVAGLLVAGFSLLHLGSAYLGGESPPIPAASAAAGYLDAQGSHKVRPREYELLLQRYTELVEDLSTLKGSNRALTARIDEAVAQFAGGDSAALENVLRDIKTDAANRMTTSREARAALHLADLLQLQDIGAALNELREAVALDPGNEEAWLDLGDTEMIAGAPLSAKAAYRNYLAILEQSPLRATEDDRDRALGIERLAESLVKLGRMEAASERYAAAVALRERLARRTAAGETGRGELINGLLALGDVLAARGQISPAQARFEDALRLARELAAASPDNENWQDALASTLDRTGDMLLASGYIGTARTHYDEALDIRRALVAATPASIRWQPEVSASFKRLGDAAMASGDLELAMERYYDALSIIERLAMRNPADTEWQTEVATLRERIGHARLADGSPAIASLHYDDSIAIRRRLSANHPADTDLRREVGLTLGRIGDNLLATGMPSEARLRHEQAFAVAKELSDRDPANTLWRRDRARAEEKLTGSPP